MIEHELDITMVPVDNGELCLHRLGGNGDPLLLFHATSFCGRTWIPFARMLFETRTCYSVDMVSHGLSRSTEPVSLQWAHIAANLAAVFEAVWATHGISPTPIDVAGHSMGATVAIMAAKADSQLVRSGWFFEPILFGSDGAQLQERSKQLTDSALKRKEFFESRQEAFNRFSERPPMNDFVSEVVSAFCTDGLKATQDGYRLSLAPRLEADIYLNANSGVADDESDLRFRSTFVVGADDQDRIPSIYETADKWGVDVTQFDDMGHFGVFTHPEALGEHASTWFGGSSD